MKLFNPTNIINKSMYRSYFFLFHVEMAGLVFIKRAMDFHTNQSISYLTDALDKYIGYFISSGITGSIWSMSNGQKAVEESRLVKVHVSDGVVLKLHIVRRI